MARKIRNAKRLQAKSRRHEVKHVYGTLYQVISGTSGERYNVRVESDGSGAICDCKWGQYRPGADRFRSGCSHVQAVFDYIAEGRTVSAWTSEEDAHRQHRPILSIGDGVVLTSRKAGT